MTPGLIKALYNYYICGEYQVGIKMWVRWASSWEYDAFIGIDNQRWKIVQSQSRPQEFCIPFELFIKDEFNA